MDTATVGLNVTITNQVVVYAPEGRETPPFSPLPLSPLWGRQSRQSPGREKCGCEFSKACPVYTVLYTFQAKLKRFVGSTIRG
jgi:hypothetical protein